MFEALSDEYQREMADAAARSTGMQQELTSQPVADLAWTAGVDMEYTALILATQQTED
jgi:hypothetical protein